MTEISVLILTKNEELDLPDCLDSLAWSDDIWILDSESVDRTTEIAHERKVNVHVRQFDGFASQRNFGLKSLPFKHDWVLIIDADERVTPQLAVEMKSFVRSAGPTEAAARVQRRDFFMNRHLKHAQISPFFIRLVRPAKAHYEREVNEALVVDGAIRELSSMLDHFPFSKGITHWIDKHNLYSSMESIVISNQGQERPSIKDAFFEKDFNLRRSNQKKLFYRLPGRPIIKFFYMLVLRRSFLDGMPGIHYTLLQCIYEYFISLKASERK